jgi:hypothetical protein
METPHLELRKTDEGLYELYKDGLPSGREYHFSGEEILELDDELFDLTAAGMPIDLEITVFPRFNGKPSWTVWIDALWDGKFVNIHIACCFDHCGEENKRSVFNHRLLTYKIMIESWEHGFTTSLYRDEDLAQGFDKKFSARGNLRDKVKTALGIIENLKAKAESEILEAISKGELFMDIPDVDKLNQTKKK